MAIHLLGSKGIGNNTSPTPICLHGDNSGAIQLTENATFRERTKHIDARYHWIRDQVHTGTIKIDYQPGSDLVADGLTKPHGRVKFKNFVKQLGVTSHLEMEDRDITEEAATSA